LLLRLSDYLSLITTEFDGLEESLSISYAFSLEIVSWLELLPFIISHVNFIPKVQGFA